jgi:hypothetical protein
MTSEGFCLLFPVFLAGLTSLQGRHHSPARRRKTGRTAPLTAQVLGVEIVRLSGSDTFDGEAMFPVIAQGTRYAAIYEATYRWRRRQCIQRPSEVRCGVGAKSTPPASRTNAAISAPVITLLASNFLANLRTSGALALTSSRARA